MPVPVIERLRSMGHTVVITTGADRVLSECFAGRGQIIMQHPISGVYAGGSDGRGDGCVYGY